MRLCHGTNTGSFYFTGLYLTYFVLQHLVPGAKDDCHPSRKAKLYLQCQNKRQETAEEIRCVFDDI